MGLISLIAKKFKVETKADAFIIGFGIGFLFGILIIVLIL